MTSSTTGSHVPVGGQYPPPQQYRRPTPRSTGPTPGLAFAIILVAAVMGFLGGALFAVITNGANNADAPPSPSESVVNGQPTPSPGDSVASLTLTTDVAAVAPDGRIGLAGTLNPAAEGVLLQVERSLDGGAWADFPVTTETKGDGSYSTVVRSGRVGENQFRLVANIDGTRVESPIVTVVIGG